jgi:hypothetical protein
MYEAANWTPPNQTAPNRAMQSQTKACLAKSLCVDVKEHSTTKVN